MNVGQLKQKLAEVDDNVLIVTPSFDHSYTGVGVAEKTTSITCERRLTLSEDHFSELDDDEVRIDVFLIE